MKRHELHSRKHPPCNSLNLNAAQTKPYSEIFGSRFQKFNAVTVAANQLHAGWAQFVELPLLISHFVHQHQTHYYHFGPAVHRMQGLRLCYVSMVIWCFTLYTSYLYPLLGDLRRRILFRRRLHGIRHCHPRRLVRDLRN